MIGESIRLANDAECVQAILLWREIAIRDAEAQENWPCERLYFMLPEQVFIETRE